MAGSLDYRIAVNILAGAPLVSTVDFSTILLLSDGAAFAAPTTLVKEYNSASAIDADSELDAATKALAKQLFAQSLNPGKIKIGEAGVGADFGADLLLCHASDPDFYAVCANTRTQAELEALADDVETLEKIAILQTSDAAVPAGTPANVLLNLQAAAYSRVAVFYHATDTEALDLSLLAYKLQKSPDVGAMTFANTNLTGIAADALTDTERATIVSDGGNVYMPFGGIGASFPGVAVDGGFLDQIVSGDWLATRIREAITQLLLDAAARNEKIPYTQSGIQQIANVVSTWLGYGEQIGHLRPGSSEVDVPLLESISAATIAARTLTLTARAILAGAIDQLVTINIGISAS